MRKLLSFTLVLTAWMLGAAEGPVRCAVCGQSIRGKFFWADGPSVSGQRPVCIACNQLDTTCSSCGMPVKANFKTLEDGRLLCEEEAAVAILSQASAQDTFASARHDLLHLLAAFGTLPDRNVKIHLVSKREIQRMQAPTTPGHSKSSLMGLTQTTVFEGGRMEHDIFAVDGLPPARFLAVCAHEWAHAWIHENVSRTRKLDGYATEGFCEWVAYKLMTERNEEIEKKLILANTYTRGQVDAFIKADQELRAYDIVKWMKAGADRRIEADNTARVRTLQDRPAEAAGPQPQLWQSAAPTKVPDRLILKGISGTGNRRFALINDCTLGKDETGKVRVGSSNVVLQCLEIRPNSVVVKVRGTEQTTELFLVENR